LNTVVDKQIHIIRAYDGKVIGTSDGTTFRKTIRGSLHLLRCPPAIAIDARAYSEQIAPTHERIEALDTESDKLYSISVESFERHKESLNYGYGEQVYVRLRYWQCELKNGARQLQLW
jgi:hypothetical protein